MLDMKPGDRRDPIPLDQYPKPPRSLPEPKIEPPAIIPPAIGFELSRHAPLVERQIDALCNKLLSLGVTRAEIAAILTATSEPYVGPQDGP